MPVLDIESFIAERRGAGQLESEGSFDVDRFGALRKTLSSALPEHHYYLFQAAQGLVKAGVENIKVAIGRQSTRMSFHDPDKVFDDRAALLSLLEKNLSISTNRPESLLVSGMATALGSDIAVVTLSGGSSEHNLTFSMNEAAVIDGQKSSTTTLEFRRASVKHLTFNWSRIWGARKEEFRLRKRFEYSPIILNIAGLKTSPSPSWRREVRGAGSAGPVVLLEAVVFDEDGVNHCGEDPGWTLPVAGRSGLYTIRKTESEESRAGLPPEEEREQCPRDLFLAALNSDGEPVEGPLNREDWARRRWTLYFTSGGDCEGKVWFVRNGCLLGPAEHSFGYPGLKVIAPADDLEVDASGYQLVDNEAYRNRLAEGERLAQRATRTLDEATLRAHYPAISPEADAEAGDIEGLLQAFPWLQQ